MTTMTKGKSTSLILVAVLAIATALPTVTSYATDSARMYPMLDDCQLFKPMSKWEELKLGVKYFYAPEKARAAKVLWTYSLNDDEFIKKLESSGIAAELENTPFVLMTYQRNPKVRWEMPVLHSVDEKLLKDGAVIPTDSLRIFIAALQSNLKVNGEIKLAVHTANFLGTKPTGKWIGTSKPVVFVGHPNSPSRIATNCMAID